MTNAYQAFKALAPSSISLEHTPGSTPVDKNIAHGDLAGLCELPYLFGMAYYGGDFSGIGRLYELFEAFSEKKAKRRHWRVSDPQTLKIASKVALDIHLYPQYYILCRTCGGSGSQRGVHRGKTCKSCEGTGKKPQTGAELSRLLGIDKSNLKRTWNSRLNILCAEVQSFHSKIAKHLDNRNDSDIIYLNVANLA